MGHQKPHIFASKHPQTTGQEPQPKHPAGYNGCHASASGVTNDPTAEDKKPVEQNDYTRSPHNLLLAISSNRLIRSSRGGWVLKRVMRPPPVKGFTMNMWAVAGLASIGTRSAAC